MSLGILAEKEETWIALVTFPANAPIGTEVSVRIQRMAGGPEETTILIPTTEVVHITDIYETAAPAVDMLVDVEINGVPQRINAQLGTMRTDLVQRNYLLKTIPLLPAAIVAFRARNLAAIGASAVSETFFVKVLRFPVVWAR